MIYPENAEVHILEDEDASRAYLLQVWAEAMTVYRSGHYSMKFSKSIQRQLVEVQKDFMPEDTEAGQIQGFLEHYTGSMVCSKQLFKEALGHTYDEPKRWQLHNINEIMNTVVTGWKPFSNPRMFAGYGRQKGWERDASGNESNEIFQENSQSKIYRPDGSLQFFRCSLPEFVAGAAVRPVSIWR